MDPGPIATDRLDLSPFGVEAIQALIERDAERLRLATGAVFPAPLDPPRENEDILPVFRDRLLDDPSIAPWWVRLIVRRETREALGSAGLGGRPDETGTVIVGYAVDPEHRGHGFATEALHGLVARALAQPGVRPLRATIPPGNTPSLRVAEKTGLRPVITALDDEVGEVLFWEIEADKALA